MCNLFTQLIFFLIMMSSQHGQRKKHEGIFWFETYLGSWMVIIHHTMAHQFNGSNFSGLMVLCRCLMHGFFLKASWLPYDLCHYEKLCLQRSHYLATKVQNHSSIIVLQLHPSKCNSYATTLYKYIDFINKFPHQKLSQLFDNCTVVLNMVIYMHHIYTCNQLCLTF